MGDGGESKRTGVRAGRILYNHTASMNFILKITKP